MPKVAGSPEYIQELSLQSITTVLDKVQQQSPFGVFILCSAQSYQDENLFDHILKNISYPVFGGVFPAIVYEERVYEQGMLVVPVHTPFEMKLYTDMQNVTQSKLSLDFDLEDVNALLVLVDGLSRNIDFVLNEMFLHYGQNLKVFGGGAGSLSFEQKPYIFSNQGVSTDAMLVVALQQSFKLAIGHGWEVLAGPFLANKTDDHQIDQLNFQPALKVYQEIVEQHDGRLFSEHEFFDLAKTYPFGIERLDDDILVRDPVTCKGDSLVCVGKIPENTMLYILKGEKSNLINAATLAVKDQIDRAENTQSIIFDCISRQLFLEQEYTTELHQISTELGPKSNMFGALVLGEIASGLSGAIHFHNKTAVVAIAD